MPAGSAASTSRPTRRTARRASAGGFELFFFGYGSGESAFLWTWPAAFVEQFLAALCFAELAGQYPAGRIPVYQWSEQITRPFTSWPGGWVLTVGSMVTLAAVAVACQVVAPPGRKDEWLAARLEDLDYGDIDGIEAAVRAYPLEGVKKDEADKELGYFLNNAPRMRCKWFRSRGLFVGSGVVESGCKAVIGQRLKLSGMRWTVTGADAIATLRCQQASRPEDRIWLARYNQTVPA
jgi:hypothetical protein